MLDQAQNSKTFTNCQATYQQEPCLLFEKIRHFFRRASVQIGLTPPPPVRFCLLFKDCPPPSMTDVLFECPHLLIFISAKISFLEVQSPFFNFRTFCCSFGFHFLSLFSYLYDYSRMIYIQICRTIYVLQVYFRNLFSL